jgi:glycerol-3-phosphate acyltransferase PlsY
MSDPADTATMLGEMATIGTAMLLACVAVWAVMVYVYNRYAGTEEKEETVVTA